VEFKTLIICSKCQQPIVSREGYGFACFKIPGQDAYHFFHRRFLGEDCWDAYMREGR
jgi:hypothetical protein